MPPHCAYHKHTADTPLHFLFILLVLPPRRYTRGFFRFLRSRDCAPCCFISVFLVPNNPHASASTHRPSSAVLLVAILIRCLGGTQVNRTERTYTKTQDYYTLGQFSKYVERGAVYLASTGSYDYPDGTGVQLVAFLNPSGTRTLVIINKIHNQLHVQATFSADAWSAIVPARSVMTWVLP